MDHRVPDVEFAQVLDQRFDITDLLLLLAPSGRGTGGKKFCFRDKVDAGFQPGEADMQRRGGNAQGLAIQLKLSQACEGGGCQATGVKKVQQAGLATFAFGQHQHPLPGLAKVLLQACQRLLCTADRGQIGQGPKRCSFSEILSG